MLVLLLACQQRGPAAADPAPRPPPAPTAPSDPTTAPGGSSGDTAAATSGATAGTSATLPCAADPAQGIAHLVATQPWHENELRIAFDTAVAAPVAATCTLRSDPSDVHLAEGGSGTSHVLRMSGLLAESDYDCVAAAVCPATVAPAAFSVTTRPHEPGLAQVTTTSYGPHGDDWILLEQSRDCGSAVRYQRVVDRQGRNRWWYQQPDGAGASVEFRSSGHDTFSWGGGWAPNDVGRPRIVDLYDGETYDSARALGPGGAFHHDGKQLADGRLLTLEQVPVEGSQGRFDGFRVRRVDPATDTVDLEYDSQRAVDEGHLPSGTGDAWHANWVDLVDGTLYVSLCNLSWIVAIDAATGDWRWTWGAGGDFRLLDEAGDPLDDRGFTSCQHDPDVADGTLLVYDNGRDTGQSRVTAYRLDEATLTSQRLWSWTEPQWYESIEGGADFLPDGHALVTAAHEECYSTTPGDHTTLWDVDPVAGAKVWELQYPDVHLLSYRGDWAAPCALFADAAVCATVADRVAELAPVLQP